MAERRELSSPYGSVLGQVLPGLILALACMAALFSFAITGHAPPIFVWVAVAMAAVGFAASRRGLLKDEVYRVWIDDTHLELRGHKDACLVPLAHIGAVRSHNWGRICTITIELSEPCIFGKSIAFDPAEDPYAKEKFEKSSRILAELSAIADGNARRQ